MAGKLDELIAQLTSKVNSGISMQDQSVLRALEMKEVKAKIKSMLDGGYSLVSASALPSSLPNVAQVLFQFNPPPGTASLGLPGIIAAFDRETSKLVSISEEVQTSASASAFGPTPFALATPSFSRAAAVPTHDPALMQRDARRGAFEGQFHLQGGRFASRSTGTSVGCYQDTPYNTSQSYDTNGKPDYTVITDYSQDWVIDDITNDDPE